MKKGSVFALNFTEQKTKPPFVISSKSKDVHVITSHIKEEPAENESVNFPPETFCLIGN